MCCEFGDKLNAAAALGNLGIVAYHQKDYTTATARVDEGLTLWRDLDCDGVLDAGEPTLPASLPLTAGEQVCVIAKHLAPLGAPAGAREQATLTASFTYDGASPALAAARTQHASLGGGLRALILRLGRNRDELPH